MTKKSELPAPNKPVSVLLNHQLRRDNAAICPRLDVIETSGNEFRAEIKALKEGVEDILPAQLQVLDSSLKAADEKREAEIQTLREEVKTAVDHAQGLARDFKAADEKHRVEIQMLTEGMEAVKRKFEDISEQIMALKEANRDTIVVAANGPRKKSKLTTSTARESTNTPSNEAPPAISNADPITQADEGTPQSKSRPGTAPSATPTPEMDTSATIVASTPTVPLSLPNTPRFHNGHIHQGDLSLKDYTTACAHHVATIRAADQNLDEPGPAELDAMVKFVLGMRENRERRRLVEDLKRAGWAAVDPKTKAVEFYCGWRAVEEALKGWEAKAGDGLGGRK